MLVRTAIQRKIISLELFIDLVAFKQGPGNDFFTGAAEIYILRNFRNDSASRSISGGGGGGGGIRGHFFIFFGPKNLAKYLHNLKIWSIGIGVG